MKSANKLWGVIFALALGAAAYCEAGEYYPPAKIFSQEGAHKKAAEPVIQPAANPAPAKPKLEDRARQEYEQHIKETRSKRRMWDTMMCPSRIYDRG